MNPPENPVETLYNALAPCYRELVAMDKREISTILLKLPDQPGWALDLGCGAGRLAVPLANAGWKVHGVDLSPVMVAETADYARDMGVGARVTCTVTDFSDPTNLPDGPFDLVLAIGSLFHVTEDAVLARLLGAVAERLRPGGLLVMDMETEQSAWISDPDFQEVDGEGTSLRIRKHEALVVEAGRTRVHLTVQRESGLVEAVKMHTSWADEEDFRTRLSDAGYEVVEVQPDWGGAGASGLLYTARRL